VKKAMSMCVDRQQIISVIYDGQATLANQSVIGPFGINWQSPDDQKLQFNCDQANAMLDQLGYKRGANGIRVAPATTGKYAQPAHPMQYQIMVPGSLDFNGSREFSIVADGWSKLGIKVTQQAGGDSAQAYAIETDDNCDAAKSTGYAKFDIALWDWFSYTDPDFQLSVATKGQWCSWSDTGYDNPSYDQMYKQSGTLAGAQRLALVQKMDKLLSDQWIYTFLVNEKAISAAQPKWGGYHPELNGYNYGYMTEPYQK
jgi:peptide/nickel transport system substrate-binding protein